MAVTATSRSIARNLIGQKALVRRERIDPGSAAPVAVVALGQAGADVVVNYVRTGGRRRGGSSSKSKAPACRLTPIRPTWRARTRVEAMFAAMLARIFGNDRPSWSPMPACSATPRSMR